MESSCKKGGIVILDFGGQYAHLIGSRIRRADAFSQIFEAETSAELLKDAAGIILSGGPQSVYDPNSPQADTKIFDLGIPILGICYGLQWMTKALGGEVKQGEVKEYGRANLKMKNFNSRRQGYGRQEGKIIKNMPSEIIVWMSHGDEAVKLPEGFELFGTSDFCKNAAFADEKRHFYAVQFHPEVTHTEYGDQLLKNFVSICNPTPWSVKSYAENISRQISEEVGDKKVFMLVSGGVDSSVAFTLLNKVLGKDRVQGLLVDTGLMRKNEVNDVMDAFKNLGITNLHAEDASEEFYSNLKDVYDPEEKRKIIGQTFLDVQKRVSEEMQLSINDGWMLGQGTIYPDTIETGITKHADKIKTHHNRVEAVQKMIDSGLVIEPLKDLYKDEVRNLGEELGLPHNFVWRHPFPGPGLGVRILCAKERDMRNGKMKTAVAKAMAVKNEKGKLEMELNVPYQVLPVKSVGVQGDGRTYRYAVALFKSDSFNIDQKLENIATDIPNKYSSISRVLLCTSHSKLVEFKFTFGFITKKRADLLREADAIVHDEMFKAGLYEKIWQFPVVLLPFGVSDGGQSIVLRPIDSTDAMTASAVALPAGVLQCITNRILALNGIDMVFIDLTNKPPGTIEWE